MAEANKPAPGATSGAPNDLKAVPSSSAQNAGGAPRAASAPEPKGPSGPATTVHTVPVEPAKPASTDKASPDHPDNPEFKRRLEAAKQNAQGKNAGEVAQSAASAIQKVADAAVAELRKAPAQVSDDDFTISGSAGGRFDIRGNGFGASGTVLVGGQPALTDAWSVMHISGILPQNVKHGDKVEVHVDAETVRRGTFKG